jgi:hypothetical protein
MHHDIIHGEQLERKFLETRAPGFRERVFSALDASVQEHVTAQKFMRGSYHASTVL